MTKAEKKPKTPKEPKKKLAPKLWRDVIAHRERYGGLVPDEENPYCIKCGLHNCGSKRFVGPHGADDPWVTVIFNGVSAKEDDTGVVATDGSSNGRLRTNLEEMAKGIGFPIDKIRYLPLTRCANRTKANVDYKTKGNWCRTFGVDDLNTHPPRMILAVGSDVLGLLSHKSNAQDWSGKLLTYRGWPDDWLTDKHFDESHPAHVRPDGLTRIPLMAVQLPGIVYKQQNIRETAKWRNQMRLCLELAMEGTAAPEYDRPYFQLLEDKEKIKEALEAIPVGVKLTYDTETTGLLPFLTTAKIVAMMFRYDSDDGPVCFGFPWDFPESSLVQYVEELTPYVLSALYRSKIQGHNLTFDILYTFATLKDVDLWSLTQAMSVDTRHLIYTLHQTKESLGLDLVAYRWCPDMAGYEEDFTLLMKHDINAPFLDPAANKGGHYSRALEMGDWARQVYRIYIMGDVEVCHVTADNVRDRLSTAKTYAIPMADPNRLGTFKDFYPPHRSFAYERIMQPGSRVLTRMMARGMHVDQKELVHQEDIFPKMISEARANLGRINEQVVQWCEEQQATVKDWTLDLESRDQLKHILFNILKLPVKRLTKTGIKLFGEDLNDVPEERLLDYAAIDKYTINALVAENPHLKPLQDYRKTYKSYTSFVRSMRNITVEGIDKHARKRPQYLQPDGRVHCSFNQCSTRGGRLSASGPNLQQLTSGTIIKRMYASRFGDLGCIYQGDLSQIELRLLACVSGDPLLVDAYRRGIDLHSLTTSKVFRVPYDHYDKNYMGELQKKGKDKEAKILERQRHVGKCVDPSTWISVNGRLTRIGDLHPGRGVDEFYDLQDTRAVQTHTGTAVMKKFYSNGVSEKVLVCTRRGIVACTPVHRFLTEGGDLVMAKDLKKGDILEEVQALEAGTDQLVSVSFNPLGKDLPVTGTFWVNATSDMCYVLGMFYGDGSCSRVSAKIITGGTPEYFSWQDQVSSVLSSVGFHTKIVRTEADNTDDPDGFGGCYGSVTFGSIRVLDILQDLGAVKTGEDGRVTRTLRVPTWLMNASRELKMQFLGGLFDTDGSIVRAGSLAVVTKSWQLAQDVVVMLRSIGCTNTLEPRYNTKYKKWYYRINITVRDSWDFFRGYVRYPAKAERLHAPAFRYGEEKPNAVTHILLTDPGEVVDISLSEEPHLYVANGLTCHNTANFLTSYGGGAFGLQTMLAEEAVYLDFEECERIVNTFFDIYSSLKRHIGLYKNFIMNNGCAISVFGRVRPLPEIESSDQELVSKGLRAGYNQLIQPTASDMMLICISVIDAALRDQELESMVVSTVHDSLVIDALRSELPAVHAIVDEVINTMPDILDIVLGPGYDSSWCRVVPLTGECEVGRNYFDSSRIVADKETGQVDWDAINAKMSGLAA